jgi:AcrR family transcriptional regulator
MAMAAPELTRRERKKDRTRRALVEAALGLFSARGFDATTVEDIAEVVDVSSRTFHRYFPVKEDVLFADSAERREQFDEVLRSRPEGEDLLDTLRAAGEAFADLTLADPHLEVVRQRLVDSTPALRAHGLRHTDEWGRIVARHAAARLGQGTDDLLPQLLADATVAVLRNARRQWAQRPGVDLRREIDRGFDLIADLAGATSASRPTKRTR